VEPPTLPPSGLQSADRDEERVPGLVVVFTGGAAAARVLRFPDPGKGGGALALGRGEGSPNKLDDGRISRRHALVEVAEGRFTVTDLASQNGTFVDGRQAPASAAVALHRVLRLGDSLLMPCADVRPFERRGVAVIDGFVRGPAMQALLDEAGRAGRSGTALHVCGESGSGKEGVAQAFHQASPRAGRPLVAVNCATIPHELAERLLFGAKRGAYSGAIADATGYIQEADGGTLFLDEIGELDPQVQAKLLRVLESKELVPLGAVKPRTVDFALCSATNKDLRGMVAAGALREDLYFRVGRPAVTLPPLRDRMEELPALITVGLSRMTAELTAHVSLVEQCLLRPWPGNVRELMAELASAAQAALAEGGGHRVAAHHLAPTAGSAFGPAMPRAANAAAGDAANGSPGDAPTHGPNEAPNDAAPGPRKRVVRTDAEWRTRIEETLRGHAGNIAAAARALGLHRTQLRRLIERHGVSMEAIAEGTSEASTNNAIDDAIDDVADDSTD
jgi:transcriptional regulator with GAF, ATPase, and Fis domain